MVQMTMEFTPVTVRIYDSNTDRIVTRLLDMYLTTGTSSVNAANIFTAINNALESQGIPWVNCVSLSVDNTSVNMGKYNSIRSRAILKNSSLYMMKCSYHNLHNTTQKASQTFGFVCTYLVDTHYNILFDYFIYRLLDLMLMTFLWIYFTTLTRVQKEKLNLQVL